MFSTFIAFDFSIFLHLFFHNWITNHLYYRVENKHSYGFFISKINKRKKPYENFKIHKIMFE
jgi:hypothetical protein